MKLTCGHCDYTWDYGGSQKYYASCPSCRYKVKINGLKKRCKTCDAIRKTVEDYRDNRDHWDWDHLIDDILMDLKPK